MPNRNLRKRGREKEREKSDAYVYFIAKAGVERIGWEERLDVLEAGNLKLFGLLLYYFTAKSSVKRRKKRKTIYKSQLVATLLKAARRIPRRQLIK